MGQILLLSNGHGEDVSGALIGQALQSMGHSVQALPLAGLGSPYQQAGITLLDAAMNSAPEASATPACAAG